MTTPTQADALDLLSRLIATPSVNPGKRFPFESPFGEERMVDLLRSLLESWGGEVLVQEVLPGRANVIARFGGREEHPALMLEAHSDTVSIEGMTIEPFAPRLEGGRLHGRGASDVKGTLAAMLLGLKAVLDEDRIPPVTVYLVSTCDEELGLAGARDFARRGPNVDAAIVGEPTDLAIIHATKGALRWRLTTEGVAAHSSDPSRGRNAIYHMRRIVQHVEEELIPRLASKSHPLLGGPAMTVGVIQGGTQVNIVPDSCRIEVDRRVLPNEERETITDEFTEEMEAVAHSAGFDFTLEEDQWYPPFEQAADSPVVEFALTACRRALGECALTTAPWAANSGVFSEAGIPCVLFGPGSIRQAHTVDEFIELDQVVRAAAVYAEMIRTFRVEANPRPPRR